MLKIRSSEITPEHLYRSRRQFLKLGAVGAGAALLAACSSPATPNTPLSANTNVAPSTSATTDELGNPLNTFDQITTYNNYYEFSTDKREVSVLAKNFPTNPWTVTVGGLVNNPKTYDLDALKKFQTEERIYRLRCVEAWSMVIPWQGFTLAQLLKDVEPTSEAKYVRFESILAPDDMPGQSSWSGYNWPYIEGLRLDEALHDLTLLATGLYGQDLPPQNGAPVRLVTPWKNGFKGIKAIVKIDLVAEQPTSLWMTANGREYGFYANVNPEVDHPRWSQASERRIGELGRRETLKFNGYEAAVAGLYAGMDLSANY